MANTNKNDKIVNEKEVDLLTKDYLSSIICEYDFYFKVAKKTVRDKADQYISGLFCAERGKRNMERMVEEVKGSEYESLQHFISDSPWDSTGLMRQLSRTASKELEPYGLIGGTVDEKAHLKKGDKSVGVSRQYAGTIGKVENCQVGVYLSLCAGKYALLTNHRLYLPEEWTNDKERCKKAGVPEDRMIFKTKPQLALEMIKEHLEHGVHFDYIILGTG